MVKISGIQNDDFSFFRFKSNFNETIQKNKPF